MISSGRVLAAGWAANNRTIMNEKCCPRPGVIFEIFPLLHQAPAKARVELLNFDIDNLLNIHNI